MAKKKTMPEKKAINVTLPIMVSDAGDGSAIVFVFKTLQDAEKAAEAELTAGNPTFSDNVTEIDITVSEDGELLSGFEDIAEFVSERMEDDLLSDDDESDDDDEDDDEFGSDSDDNDIFSDDDDDDDYREPDEEEQ